MENFVRREVIRSQLEHLALLLSKEGEECFIITACIVDGSFQLFGSSKGVEYIQNYFKGVVEEFLPYLSQQDMPERVYTRQVVDDYNDAKKAIRSMIVYQACRLAENGEECFVVTATNPNILGSDKGVAYCGILFQGIQRAFSRHVEAHQTADRDQAVEQGPETSTEDVHSVHSKLQTHLKIENPIRHESENDHCGNNSNDKGEPCPTPRKDDSDLLGSGTDEDSTNADSLLSESELLAESSKWETTGLKRTNQMDEVNSDKKRFKPVIGCYTSDRK
ncbi:hypothetical protein MAR_014739 [Mya arenaria]|uniref:Uncharacterized protein n=1 Tax=Mya arenaria TaxID=6604 RepID=A0ABY7FEZ5_MYAAR|nr:hypothetical protein MAR_014739 [Mya arenaria]